MSAKRHMPPLPYVLLGAMTLVSFGGPFVMLAVIRGGQSGQWPPDRPIEWITIGAVSGLAITLFCACVSIGRWYRAAQPGPGVSASTRSAPRVDQGDSPAVNYGAMESSGP